MDSERPETQDGAQRPRPQHDPLRPLWRRVVKGDPEAREEFVRLVDPQVRAYVRGLCWGNKSSYHEDLAQEFWLKVFTNAAKYRPRRTIMGQMIKTAYNVVLGFRVPRDTPFTDLEAAQDKEAGGAQGMVERIPSGSVIWGRNSSKSTAVTEDVGLSDNARAFFLCLFRHGGPPHALAAYLFNALDCGVPGSGAPTEEAGQKSGTPSGSAQRVVDEISRYPLRVLFEYFFGVMAGKHGKEGWQVRRLADPVLRILDKKAGAVIRDPRVRKRLAEGLEVTIGDTCLDDYFGGNPTADISNWSHRVRENVRNFFEI